MPSLICIRVHIVGSNLHAYSAVSRSICLPRPTSVPLGKDLLANQRLNLPGQRESNLIQVSRITSHALPLRPFCFRRDTISELTQLRYSYPHHPFSRQILSLIHPAAICQTSRYHFFCALASQVGTHGRISLLWVCRVIRGNDRQMRYAYLVRSE
jgi:hypothetical protein